MTKRFQELLINISDMPLDEQKTILDDTIMEWKGPAEEQTDDILVIGFRI